MGTADVPGGDRVHALFSEVTRAPSSLSLSVPVSLPLSVSLSPPAELRGPPPGRPFSRTLSSLPEALRDPWDTLQHPPECSQARGSAEKEGTHENAQGIRGRKMLTHTATGSSSWVSGVQQVEEVAGICRENCFTPAGCPGQLWGLGAQGTLGGWADGWPGEAGPSQPPSPSQERSRWARRLQQPSSDTLQPLALGWSQAA